MKTITILIILLQLGNPAHSIDITDWPVGCWNCRSWGAMRLLEDGYCIDTDPEGLLNDWGVWQYFGGTHEVIVVWMESSRIEIIRNDNGKYYHQTAYSFGIGSPIEEVKKIGK